MRNSAALVDVARHASVMTGIARGTRNCLGVGGVRICCPPVDRFIARIVTNPATVPVETTGAVASSVPAGIVNRRRCSPLENRTRGVSAVNGRFKRSGIGFRAQHKFALHRQAVGMAQFQFRNRPVGSRRSCRGDRTQAESGKIRQARLEAAALRDGPTLRINSFNLEVRLRCRHWRAADGSVRREFEAGREERRPTGIGRARPHRKR